MENLKIGFNEFPGLHKACEPHDIQYKVINESNSEKSAIDELSQTQRAGNKLIIALLLLFTVRVVDGQHYRDDCDFEVIHT